MRRAARRLERTLRAGRASLRIAFDLARTLVTPAARLATLADAGEPGPLRTRPAATADAALPEVLRLVTWNVHRGYDPAGVAAGLARLRRELDPDLLLLQEVPVTDRRPFWEWPEVAPSLAGRALAWAPMHRVLRQDCYYDFAASGQLTISRWRLRAHRMVALPVASVPKLGRAHRVRRCALLVELGTPEAPLTVANLHLENTARPAGRALQMAAAVAALGTGPAVVAGDLNSFLGAREPLWHAASAAGLQPVPMAAGGRLLPRIDHVLARGVTGVDGRELAVGGSDHRPVAATLAVPAALRGPA